jgi:hypothetical protein
MKIGYDWPMAEMDSHKWVKAVGRENHGSCMAGTGREFLNNRRGKTKKYRRESRSYSICMVHGIKQGHKMSLLNYIKALGIAKDKERCSVR